MNKVVALIAFLFLLPSLAQISRASHIIGGDMSYHCNGNNEFVFTLKIYRDCFTGQVGFSDPATLVIWAGDDFSSPWAALGVNPEIVNIPPEVDDPCLVIPPNICVEEGTYSLTVTLPFNPAGYHVTYDICCRNPTITNIVDPDVVGATYTVFLSDLAQSSCNNSPVFDDFPPIVICRDVDVSFDHGATDPEGDSIVYYFCTPLDSDPGFAAPPYDEVIFVDPPFNAQYPMGGNPLVTIDSTTGVITGVPVVTGQYVVGVCMEEYRNGQLLSTLQRDFQFNVTYCAPLVNADIQEDIMVGPNGFLINQCGDSTVNFINQSTDPDFINEYSWEFDIDGNLFMSDEINPTIMFPDTGFYQGVLILNENNGQCKDSADIFVNIYPPIMADFSVDFDSCAPGPMTFIDESTTGSFAIVDWLWNFNDGNATDIQNPIHEYMFPGSYGVSLRVTDDNGCDDIITQTVEWQPATVISFTADVTSGCEPITVQFQNTSLPFDNNYSLEWDFGDGTSETGENPIHTYDTAGVYTLILTSNSPLGCVESDTFPNFINVFEEPVADFDFAFDSCQLDAVQFTDLSDFELNTNISWLWEFGDNNTSDQQNPSHLYMNPGVYDVTLTVSNDDGCSTSMVRQIDWEIAPIFDVVIDPISGCAPLSVPFPTNAYPIPGYTIVWDLGDGNTTDEASPLHQYEDPGVYSLSLTITTPSGCTRTDVYQDVIVVDTLPIAQFNIVFDPCELAPLTFEDQSLPGTGDIVNWDWEFGDMSTSDDQSPVYQYSNPGDYDIQFIVENSAGCVDTADQSISWFPETTIDISASLTSGCTPLTVSFTNNSAPLMGYSFVWDFGDGNTTSTIEPSHIFSFSGDFPVTFTSTSPSGCMASETIMIMANALPIANFGFQGGPATCVFGPVPFTDLTIPGNGDIISWDWDFDDGFGSDEQNPVHLFNQAGIFNVSLTIIDENGCSSSISQRVEWAPGPVIDIVPDNPRGCSSPHTVLFQNNSFPINGYDILWDFGDGNTDSAVSPTHTYQSMGAYDVILTLISPTGCLSTQTFDDLVTVDTIPTANFIWNNDDCQDGLLNFRDQSIGNGGPITSWQWTFGDTNTSDLQNPQHAYEFIGTYLVGLLVIDENGCEHYIEQEVEWWPPARIDIEVDDYLGCIPHQVNFINNSDPINGYDILWDLGDGTISTDLEPSHIYQEPGNYDVTLMITAPTGCTSEAFFPNFVRVTEQPVADFFYSPEQPTNFNAEVQFTDASQLISQWEWDFGNGDYSFEQNPLYTYPDTGIYNVTLIVTQLSGCQDSTSKLIDIAPLYTYYLPNAFTPNEDGINDGFRGAGITYTLRFFEMNIWNRWGEIVFSTNNPQEAWNGKKNNIGRLSQSGVYIYQVRLIEARGKQHELKGFVTLVR
ncbi:MAG: PKD domain-containing protein [Bacteroidota bacterium]